MILILSADAVGAALLGALIETLGYSVTFARPPEHAEDSLRRVRPKICLLDCADPSACNDEFLGRAAMRRVSVVIFGTARALDRVRGLALEHELDTMLLPPNTASLATMLERALEKVS